MRKRSKFFPHEAGRLYYIGGERKGKATAADSNARRLVVIGKEESRESSVVFMMIFNLY